MEKKQYELCVEVLRRLDKAGVLKDVVIVGSWCLPFYSDYFKTADYATSLRTRDIDFLVPGRIKIKARIDLTELLRDLGFVLGFQGREGYIRLEHPELAIEFLVPERGRGSNKPFPLKELGINAQPLRYLHLLTREVIHAKVDGIRISLPHPALFAFHKLIISQLRKKEDKASKDSAAAVRILRAMVNKGESAVVKRVFNSMPPKWREKIIKSLNTSGEPEFIQLLKQL